QPSSSPMTAALEAVLRIALPPLKLAVRERYLRLPRRNREAAVDVAQETCRGRADPRTTHAAGLVELGSPFALRSARGGLTRIIGGGTVGRRPTHRVGFRFGSRRRTAPWANAR